ncbi:hypothetical protein [Streptomyces lydicus]|uniref:hypothetical protein n=1 Tax=Streptomyces lydicus TaxID=47763 RepID=UPI0037914A1E
MSATNSTPNTPPAPQPSGEPPLLSLRTFTVLMGAAVFGAAAGALDYAHTHSLADAVTAGGGAFFLCVLGLHKLIG